MNRIWSDNGYIDLIINVLLFMVGINFMHYGQLIFPVICLLLFIDNRLKFKVNDPKVFILLCLFGISFYAFSYKLGFYSVMGFCCPMAYYIGSNIKYPNAGNVKKIILLFAFSMALHVILNAIIEYILHGYDGFFFSSSHYDFWTREKIASTNTAVNLDLLIGCLYFMVFHEKNKLIKYGSLLEFVPAMFYLLVIGRRTPVIMLIAVMFLSFLYEMYVLKSLSPGIKKGFLILMAAGISLIILPILFYAFDLFDCRVILDKYYIFEKLRRGLFSDERFRLYFRSFSLMPLHPWGGQQISTILGEQIHELWIDIYDYAGVFSWLLMIIYSLIYAWNIYKLLSLKKADPGLQILSVGVYLCIVLQMFVEPVMTGSSLFLLVAIIIHAICEGYLHEQ